MNSCMITWSFSMRLEMLGSLLELHLTFSNALLALNMLEKAYRTQPAQAEIKNGKPCKWNYSWCLRVGIAWICCVECVWTNLRQNARGIWVVGIKLQGVPYFANGRWFCTMGGLRAQRVVFLVQGDVRKLFQKLAPVSFSWCSSFCVFDIFLVYEAKVDKMWSRLVQAILSPCILSSWPLYFVDLICCIRYGLLLKGFSFNIKHILAKMVMSLFLFRD